MQTQAQGITITHQEKGIKLTIQGMAGISLAMIIFPQIRADIFAVFPD
jgi:hypothetical protein